MKPKQNFADFVGIGVQVNELPRLIRIGHNRMSGPWRVWDVCLTRVNNYGHCAFDPGELAELATGEDSKSARCQVSRWIKTLAEMERIAPAVRVSTQLCVVVNSDVVRREAGRASDHLCSEPAHRGRQKQRWPVRESSRPVADDGGELPIVAAGPDAPDAAVDVAPDAADVAADAQICICPDYERGRRFQNCPRHYTMSCQPQQN